MKNRWVRRKQKIYHDKKTKSMVNRTNKKGEEYSTYSPIKIKDGKVVIEKKQENYEKKRFNKRVREDIGVTKFSFYKKKYSF